MGAKLKRIIKFILFFIYSNAIYGVIVFLVFTWLSKYSLLAGYLGNLALIIIGLAIDSKIRKFVQPQNVIKQLENEKDAEKGYRYIQLLLENYVSFKIVLYLFYVIILILSQVLAYNPTLLSENISNFIIANEYSIMFLMALDMLFEQFRKDKSFFRTISENLKNAISEKDDTAETNDATDINEDEAEDPK